MAATSSELGSLADTMGPYQTSPEEKNKAALVMSETALRLARRDLPYEWAAVHSAKVDLHVVIDVLGLREAEDDE